MWSTISARISWATHDQFPWRDFLLFTVIIGNLQRKRQQFKSSRSILILNHFLINDLRYSSYIYKTTSKSTLVVWEEQASIVLPSELKLLSVLAILQLHKGAVHERCRPNVKIAWLPRSTNKRKKGTCGHGQEIALLLNESFQERAT